jgi:CBS domain-containing protein
MLRVKHLLSMKGNEVLCIDAEDPVLRAIQIMADNHIGALPVLRNTEMVGIVSERDYARKVILHGRSSAETPIWEIMTAPVITVTPDTSVDDCMRLVTEQRVRHLPVVEKDKLVGIVSIGDLVRAVIEEQQETITQLERFIAS